MAINTQKVLVGGVAAGVVVGVIDFVANGLVLADLNQAALDALNPNLAANMEGGAFIAFGIVIFLLYGVVIAWTYAAMRPRYGAGSKTAMIAASQLFCVITLISASMTYVGMIPAFLFGVGSVITALELAVGAWVAGYLYGEE